MHLARTVRWSRWEMVLAVLLALAAWQGAPYLLKLLNSDSMPLVSRLAGQDRTARWFIASMLLNVVFAGVPLGLLIFRHRKPVLETLLPAGRAAHDFGWGLSLGLIVASLNALSVRRAVEMAGAAGTPDLPRHYQTVFNIGSLPDGASHADFMRPLLLFVVCWGVLSPIAEEIFFRGFLYGALRRQMRAPMAVVLSSVVFAAFHSPHVETMVATMVLGIVVATVYEYSGSLLAPIMTHMGLNMSFVLTMANRGELARAIPRWVFIAAAAVFALHFFLSSRYLFRKAR